MDSLEEERPSQPFHFAFMEFKLPEDHLNKVKEFLSWKQFARTLRYGLEEAQQLQVQVQPLIS